MKAAIVCVCAQALAACAGARICPLTAPFSATDHALEQAEARARGLANESERRLIERLRGKVAGGDEDELLREFDARVPSFIADAEQRSFWSSVIAVAWIFRHYQYCVEREEVMNKRSARLSEAGEYWLALSARYLTTRHPHLYQCRPRR